MCAKGAIESPKRRSASSRQRRATFVWFSRMLVEQQPPANQRLLGVTTATAIAILSRQKYKKLTSLKLAGWSVPPAGRGFVTAEVTALSSR